MLSRRILNLSIAGAIVSGFAPCLTATAQPAPLMAEPWAQKLIDAAEAQVGVTVGYDPAYRKISFPQGDVPRQTGVCTDVIIRAYRDALGVDLQARVHADMKSNFSAYPKIWGLASTDRNIDHRRVPNLKTFLQRNGAELAIPENSSGFLPGDLVTQNLPGNLPHIALVSNRLNDDGTRPVVIHNIGGGARMEDTLLEFEITGRYRYPA